MRVAALLLMALTTTVHGAPYPVVEVGPAGPTSPMPVDDTFFLEGAVGDDVIEVQPIFVRFGWSPFGGVLDPVAGPEDCGRVQAALRWAPDQDGPIANGRQGTVDIDAIWPAPSPEKQQALADYASLVRHQEAFVPPAWTAEHGTPGTFRVRVDARRFFRPGARFCLLIAERRSRVQDDETLIRRTLVRASRGNDAPACVALGECGHDAACMNLHAGACHEQMRAAALGAIDDLSDADRIRVARALDEVMVHAATDLTWAELAVPARTKAIEPAEGWAPKAYHAVPQDDFGALVAIAAGAGDHLRAVVERRAVSWKTVDGQMTVGAVGLRRDGRRIVVADGPSADESTALDAPSSEIMIPGTAVSLYDLWLLARGEIALGGEARPLATLHRTWLAGLIGPGEDGPAPDPEGRLAAAAARLNALAALSQRVRGRRSAGIAGGMESLVDPRLDAWFDAALGDGREALERAAGAVDIAARARARWGTRVDALVVSLEEVQVVARPAIRNATDLDTATWFAHYMVPTLGYAWVSGDDYAQSYVGLELYAFANRYDEPMWTNGFSDLRRLVALELGAATGTADLGPDGRISGPVDGLPPLFLGGALHLLPYGSVSAGATLMRRRKSALGAEDGPIVAAPYVGVSLQISLIQIIGQPFRDQEASR